MPEAGQSKKCPSPTANDVCGTTLGNQWNSQPPAPFPPGAFFAKSPKISVPSILRGACHARQFLFAIPALDGILPNAPALKSLKSENTRLRSPIQIPHLEQTFFIRKIRLSFVIFLRRLATTCDDLERQIPSNVL
jgi:hypothetical protein